jgi:hypothetical protein
MAPKPKDTNEWGSVWACTQDPYSCVMVGCSCVTCGITACMIKKEIADMIGGETAEQVGSYPTQCKQCLSQSASAAFMSAGDRQHWFVSLLGCLGTAASYYLCPADAFYNVDYRLYGLAHERLGKTSYPGPFGMEFESGPQPGIQVECPFTAPCTICLMYRELKAAKEANAIDKTTQLEPKEVHPPQPFKLSSFGCTPDERPGYDWMPTCCCCQNDLIGCFMFACGPCTCFITSCLAVCSIGQLIGSDEAKEFTGCSGQLKNCANSLFPCFPCICPDYYPGNYQQKILQLAKDAMGKKYYPGSFGLPLNAGDQMGRGYMGPCTMCLILAQLKKDGAQAAANTVSAAAPGSLAAQDGNKEKMDAPGSADDDKPSMVLKTSGSMKDTMKDGATLE